MGSGAAGRGRGGAGAGRRAGGAALAAGLAAGLGLVRAGGEVLVLKDGLQVGGGEARWAATVNGSVSGPTIFAMEGQELAVEVANEFMAGARASSVHWHGMFQKGTPFMDGVPGVSFCGILPGKSFLYNFTAEPAGTHWYHSHSGSQYADGLAGALIVRPAPGAEVPEWESDPDLKEEVLLALELAPKTAETEYTLLKSGEDLGGKYGGKMLGDVPWPKWLLNGEPDGTASFRLAPGTTTRFRFINGAANYLVVLRSGLPMQLVMTDPGQYVEPTPVDAIRAAIGERYDFLVTIPEDAEPTAYQLTLSDEFGTNSFTIGTILVGDAKPSDASPALVSEGEVINTYGFPAPWRGEPAPPQGREIPLQLNGTDEPYSWKVGDVALEEPAVPLMLSGGRFGFDEDRVTTESVAVGEVVDFVLENPTGMGHPFHLHGNEFWVIETWGEWPGSNVAASDPAQRRDTVQVPAKGGARVRMRSTNPGPWFMHCHIDFHLLAGMATVVLVGDESEWPTVPEGTQLCGNAPDGLQELYAERPDILG